MFYLFKFSNKSSKIKIMKFLNNQNPKGEKYVRYNR